ncbi:unnamed protein product [Rotaria sordida]|uniref:F-box domain-containing protein n=1 Tax=Rotaria sordida TaxID=392033 RepID=A0A815HYB0_9BILA|nr:unnamed protein product [Rotaria sordida]
MKDKAIHSFLTLPVELVYRILDKLDTFTILCSMLNVCTRINVIVDDYRQHPIINTLQSLGNQLDPQTIYYLANILRHDKKITKIRLGNSAISDIGTRYLANVLQYNTTLITLDIRYNKIGPAGAQYLANALSYNTVELAINTFILNIPVTFNIDTHCATSWIQRNR